MTQATPQQAAVVSRKVEAGQVMLLNAYAGTGKTTVLELFARAHPQLRFLYLCFNRDNATEARSRFPRNCECSTIHSKAWHAVGREFGKVNNPRPRDVMDAFKIAKPFLAVFVLDTLNAFLHSADGEISLKHVCTSPNTPARIVNQVLSVAGKLWERMRKTDDDSLPMSHDGYLKLWALQEPAIRGYDIIFLDEAQDTNPVTLQIVLKQVEEKRAGLVLVGDTHQSIYSWRHAVNAMQQADAVATCRLPLTESFRFGPGIARDASLLLNHLKKDPVQLVGRGNSAGKLSSFAVLGRTNAGLIAAAVEKASLGMSIHFAATSERDNWDPFIPYKFQMTLDIYHLWSGEPRKVRDPYISKFTSFAEIEDHAQGEGEERHGRDVELALQAELVKEHGHEIPRLLEMLKKQSCGPDQAALAFSTVHRAKGKEWDAVRLLDDFIDISDQELLKETDPAVLSEEFNILYVAVTRARKKLLYPPSLYDWFAEMAPDASDAHRMKPLRETSHTTGAALEQKPAKVNRKSKEKPSKRHTEDPSPASLLEDVAQQIAAMPLQRTLRSDTRIHIRNRYARAYESWSPEEDRLLRQACQHTQDLAALVRIFARQPEVVLNRIQKLGLDVVD
ncbi:MAG: UvrD-helicase domain-containing protein [Phycisphaeraceae bacterium]